jgi:hypothetical protein
VIRCRRRWRRRRCSARVGAGHGGGGGFSEPGSGSSRCSGVNRRSARFVAGRGRWEWSGRRRRCTARTVAGCGPAVSGGRRGTPLRKRRSRTPREYLEQPFFCRVVGGVHPVLRAPPVHALPRRVAPASPWTVTGAGAPLTGHVVVAGPDPGEGGGHHDRRDRPDRERHPAALRTARHPGERADRRSPARSSPWATWRWRSSRCVRWAVPCRTARTTCSPSRSRCRCSRTTSGWNAGPWRTGATPPTAGRRRGARRACRSPFTASWPRSWTRPSGVRRSRTRRSTRAPARGSGRRTARSGSSASGSNGPSRWTRRSRPSPT